MPVLLTFIESFVIEHSSKMTILYEIHFNEMKISRKLHFVSDLNAIEWIWFNVHFRRRKENPITVESIEISRYRVCSKDREYIESICVKLKPKNELKRRDKFQFSWKWL